MKSVGDASLEKSLIVHPATTDIKLNFCVRNVVSVETCFRVKTSVKTFFLVKTFSSVARPCTSQWALRSTIQLGRHISRVNRPQVRFRSKEFWPYFSHSQTERGNSNVHPISTKQPAACRSVAHLVRHALRPIGAALSHDRVRMDVNLARHDASHVKKRFAPVVLLQSRVEHKALGQSVDAAHNAPSVKRAAGRNQAEVE